MGDIEKASTLRTTEYHHHELLNRLQDLTRLTGQDFYLDPRVENGVLRFYANWYDGRGHDKSGEVQLIEDKNIVGPGPGGGPVLDEQGEIASRVVQVGAGSTWGNDRLTGEATSSESIGLYDYREWAETTNVVNQNTLDENADEILNEMKTARKKYSVVATNVEPALFGSYDVGDTVQIQAYLQHQEWSVDDSVRVMARQWQPNDTCRLEVETV